jgi:EmrB/QacA subfamily drug resistance transporter
MSMEPSSESPPLISPARKWGGLIVLSLALAVIIIDTTLLNVSLSYIIKDLHTTLQQIQWVITAYSLMLAAFTITGGRLGDIYGRKNMFMLGAVFFAVGSFMASISHSFTGLLIGESIVEGIGAALMMPATSSLLVATFQGRERAIAFGVWGAIAAASSAVGPILGGYLTTNYTWRYGFRINIFVVIALLIGSVLIIDRRDQLKKVTLDIVGVILSSIGLLSVVFGVIESTTYGWWHAKETFITYGHALDFSGLSVTTVAIAVGILFLDAFVAWELYRERKGLSPLVSMHLLENGSFTSGTITTGIVALGQMGILFTLPVFLQGVRGFTAFKTGLAFLPLSIAILIVSPTMAALSGRFAAKRLIQIGLILDVLSLFLLQSEMKITATALQLAPGLALFGAGMGMVMSQINNLTLSAVAIQEAGEASGITNTSRQLGSTLGAAIIGAVLLSAIPTNIDKGVRASTVLPDKMKTEISTSLKAQGSNIEFSQSPQSDSSNTPPAVTEEITRIVNVATTNSNRSAILFSVIFALLGLIASTKLPARAAGYPGAGKTTGGH